MLPNSEWILLILLAVVLLKPEDVPTIAIFLAKAIKQAQNLWNSLLLSETNKQAMLDMPDKHLKKYPFHLSPPKAKSQPVKD